MSDMHSLLIAAILGVVEGLTEFLTFFPVEAGKTMTGTGTEKSAKGAFYGVPLKKRFQVIKRGCIFPSCKCKAGLFRLNNPNKMHFCGAVVRMFPEERIGDDRAISIISVVRVQVFSSV